MEWLRKQFIGLVVESASTEPYNMAELFGQLGIIRAGFKLVKIDCELPSESIEKWIMQLHIKTIEADACVQLEYEVFVNLFTVLPWLPVTTNNGWADIATVCGANHSTECPYLVGSFDAYSLSGLKPTFWGRRVSRFDDPG